MKKVSKLALLSVSVILITITACKEVEEFPDVPHIEYRGFIKLYNSQNEVTEGILQFSFTDGDGDIGLHASDPEEERNLFIDYYEKREDGFEKADFELNARIPVLTPEGSVKSIKGDIEYKIPVDYTSPYDTIKLEFYILDRAMHSSNVVETPVIILE